MKLKTIAIILFSLLTLNVSAQTSVFTVPGNNDVNINGVDTFRLTWATKDFFWIKANDATVVLQDTSTKVAYEFKWSVECRAFYFDKVKPKEIVTIEIRDGWINRIWCQE